REGVDDRGDGLGGGASVERREDEVAGFCHGERGLDGLAVAHLTDQDHVGVLSQYLTERLREAGRVAGDLTLGDETAPGLVQELDGILERHDVPMAQAVHMIDERGERRALAAARGATDQHEAAWQPGEERDDRRKSQTVEPGRRGGNGAEGSGDAATGEIEVAPEAPESGYRDGEVELALALEPTALHLGEHAGAQRARLRACQRRMIERGQLALHAGERPTLPRAVAR